MLLACVCEGPVFPVAPHGVKEYVCAESSMERSPATRSNSFFMFDVFKSDKIRKRLEKPDSNFTVFPIIFTA